MAKVRALVVKRCGFRLYEACIDTHPVKSSAAGRVTGERPAAVVPQGEQHAGKSAIPIDRALTVIGSRSRVHVQLNSRTISRTHAILGRDDGGVFIRDLASRTHVLVNGQQVREADLYDGDLVKIGSFEFRYSDKRASPLLSQSKRAPDAAVEVEGRSRPIEFAGRVLLIGRKPECDISQTEASVSNCHAVIFDVNGQRMIRDLGSRTGTYVNGERIHQSPLAIGDLRSASATRT